MFGRPFYGRAWSPWREMERMRREMNRWFASAPSEVTAYPAINVWLNEDGAVVTAELPGVSPEEIDISVVSDVLTLTGNRRPDALKEGETYHRRERSYGKFTRTFQLPFPVEPGKVEAKFKDGVLNVVLPRAEAHKPKKIAVKAG